MPVFCPYGNIVKLKDSKRAVEGVNIEKEIWATRDLISIDFMVCFQPICIPKEMKFYVKMPNLMVFGVLWKDWTLKLPECNSLYFQNKNSLFLCLRSKFKNHENES